MTDSKIARQQRQKLLEYGKQIDAKVTIKYNRGRMEAKIGDVISVTDSKIARQQRQKLLEYGKQTDAKVNQIQQGQN